jgi:hypothetical protein
VHPNEVVACSLISLMFIGFKYEEGENVQHAGHSFELKIAGNFVSIEN